MFVAGVNYLAILVAAVATMVVGALWYSPVLFGKKWMGLANKTEEELKKVNPAKAYGVTFLAAIAVAYTLARFIGGLSVTGLGGGVLVGFMAWFGLAMAASLPHYLFEDRSLNLFSINYGFTLAEMVVMGAILGVWQ